jgi:type I restriction enzyme S subunit
VSKFVIPLPPVEEQNSIVAYLSSETLRFDRLVSEAEKAVSLLNERRSALISAAVTGKIDVRKFASLDALPAEAAA